MQGPPTGTFKDDTDRVLVLFSGTKHWNQFTSMLTKEKLAEFFRQVAMQKAKGGHWRKKLQLKMGPQYQKLSFYGALSQWVQDRYGMDKKPDAIRKAIDREYELLM